MKYGLHLELTAILAVGEDLLDSIDAVAEQLAVLDDCTPELLDYSLAADAGTNSVEIDVTVAAEAPEIAQRLGLSYIRTAIHATGAGTPGWEENFQEGAQLVAFSFEEMSTKQLIDI